MIAYSIHSFNSEGALKSNTPYAHEVDKARTLDLMIGNPDCNQGGVLILHKKPVVRGGRNISVLGCFEGNGCRPSHKGLGLSTDGKTMYTLNTTEVHGVVYRYDTKPLGCGE